MSALHHFRHFRLNAFPSETVIDTTKLDPAKIAALGAKLVASQNGPGVMFDVNRYIAVCPEPRGMDMGVGMLNFFSTGEVPMSEQVPEESRGEMVLQRGELLGFGAFAGASRYASEGWRLITDVALHEMLRGGHYRRPSACHVLDRPQRAPWAASVITRSECVKSALSCYWKGGEEGLLRSMGWILATAGRYAQEAYLANPDPPRLADTGVLEFRDPREWF